MKLFYAKGACSLAPHIVMSELNMVYELEAVDLKTKACASGDYRTVNKKGSVPALRMENGEILTEGVAIMQYLADMNPESHLMPRPGTVERYRAREWLNFIATDLHKSYTPLFMTGLFVKTDEAKADLKANVSSALKSRIAFVSEALGSNDYLLGREFTIVDAYLFTVLGWSQYVSIDLSQWKNVSTYLARVAARPGVQKALAEEGLI